MLRSVKPKRGSANIQVVSQLAVFLENRPGTLSRVCQALAEASINILAISASDTIDHTVLRLVVDDPRRALFMFEERGTLVVESEVLLIEGANRPGSLAEIASRLGKAKINIEYCYCATSPNSETGMMVMRVSKAAKAVVVLRKVA